MAFDFVSASGTLKEVTTLLAILMTAYAGFMLIMSPEMRQRSEWKLMLGSIAVGLVLEFLAPLLVSQFVGGAYCG